MLRRLRLAGLALGVWLAAGAPAVGADVVAEQLDPAHTGVSAQGLGPSVPISHEVRWPLTAGDHGSLKIPPPSVNPWIAFPSQPRHGARRESSRSAAPRRC